MDSKELLARISAAFASVRLGDGVGILQAEALDNYASDSEVVIARQKDREYWPDWTNIPDQVLEQAYSALCFADPEGMRFLIPAYMSFTVRLCRTSNAASIDSTIYALDRGPDAFGGEAHILSREQVAAIVEFLEFMVVSVGDGWVDAAVASRAYENYWKPLNE